VQNILQNNINQFVDFFLQIRNVYFNIVEGKEPSLVEREIWEKLEVRETNFID